MEIDQIIITLVVFSAVLTITGCYLDMKERPNIIISGYKITKQHLWHHGIYIFLIAILVTLIWYRPQQITGGTLY
jgi:hypothetical protein